MSALARRTHFNSCSRLIAFLSNYSIYLLWRRMNLSFVCKSQVPSFFFERRESGFVDYCLDSSVSL